MKMNSTTMLGLLLTVILLMVAGLAETNETDVPVMLAILIFFVVGGTIWRRAVEEADYSFNFSFIPPTPDPRQATSYEDAKNAIDRMADWAKWLVGIQTAAMAVVGLGPKSQFEHWPHALHLTLGILAVLFLGVSTYCFGWLLAAFPSVQQRLKSTRRTGPLADNDIYAIPLFAKSSYNVHAAAACSHFLGIAGLVCFAGYFVLGLSAGEKPEVKPTTVVVDGVGNPITIKVVPPASAGTKDKAASSSAGGETGKAVGAAK